MAKISDGRTMDNGTAHMDWRKAASPALASEILLDRMLGHLRAAESTSATMESREAHFFMADWHLGRAINIAF